jgi:GTP-binding protein
MADTGEYVGEILEDGQELIVMKGGRGGLGNVYFKNATHQTPRFAQPGEEGIEGWITLELKVLADIGLVGFPNAGKSTLITQLSNARPKIADYPFTTLKPNLGMVAYREFQSFVIADIPGIIEGASEGRGLGLRFLRHIERNAALLFMIPAADEDGQVKTVTQIKKELKILQNELKQFNPELLDKSWMLAITKCDLISEKEAMQLEAKLAKSAPVLCISAVTNWRMTELKDQLWELLQPEESI